MNPSDQANNFHPISRAVLLAMLAASAAVAGFAISNQSYWIDEATSLIVAMAPNPAEAWKYANAVGGSTIQMPLYNIYLYAWHKMFGGGEWVMRAANIPFFVFGQLAFLLLLRSRPRLALTACGLSLICPTLWMYLDEARPYIMQYAAACWPTAALLRAAAPQPGDEHWKTSELLLLALGTILLAGSSLLGVLWAAGFVLVLLWLWKNPATNGQKKSPAAVYLAALAFPLVALGAFYLFTFETAGGGYFRPGTGLVSLPYVIYEFLGFSGFGPGRLELRTAPGASLRAHFFSLLPLAAVAGILGIVLLQHLRNRQPGGRLVVSFAGRLSRENYVDDLLSIARRLGSQRRDFVLVIAGSGDEEARLATTLAADPILRDVVRMVGSLDRPAVAGLRRASLVALVLMGGFSLIEAAAAGAALVSYDVEWHREIVRDGETGRLLTEHDVDGVVAAVAAFLDDPANARAMGHRAQTLALARHRLDAATRHKQRCYAALLAHG